MQDLCEDDVSVCIFWTGKTLVKVSEERKNSTPPCFFDVMIYYNVSPPLTPPIMMGGCWDGLLLLEGDVFHVTASPFFLTYTRNTRSTHISSRRELNIKKVDPTAPLFHATRVHDQI